MDITSVWTMQFTMFFLVAAGLILKKYNVIKPESKAIITDLIMDFILPCNIINSFNTTFELNVLTKFVLLLVIAFAVEFVALGMSKVIWNKKPDSIKHVLQYGTIVCNSGFLGLPVASTVFGAEGLMYTSVFIIPTRIMMWTAGVECFTEAPDMKSVVKKLVLHPCIVALYIGIPLMILQAPMANLQAAIVANSPALVGGMVTMLSTAVTKMITSAGNCTTPLVMLLIGSMLAEIKPSEFVTREVLEISVVRLFVIPCMTLVALKLLSVDSLITGVAVLNTSMPVGSTAAILAAKYGGDYELGTKCVVFSTLISLITIPIWCMFL